MSLRIVIVLISCAGSAVAQGFTNLSTTDDGSALYFLTDLRQKGTDQYGSAKIFRYTTSAGFELIEQRLDTLSFTERRLLHRPSISGDGQLLAFTHSRHCSGRYDCMSPNRFQGVLRRRAGESTMDGIVEVSRNGRYAVTFGNIDPVLTDLSTGEKWPVGPNAGSVQYRVTDDGRVLLLENGRISLWSRAGVQVLSQSRNIWDAVIDPTGRTVAYTIRGTTVDVFSYDVAAGREAKLGAYRGEVIANTFFSPVNPSFSSDGSVIAFISVVQGQNQLFVLAPNGGLRQITRELDGIVNAVLSGNSRIAYAVTGDSRLLRIEVPSGNVTELVPITPIIVRMFYGGSRSDLGTATRYPSGRVAPGSVIELQGTALSEGGRLRRATLGGREVPRFGNARYQVPWDLPPGVYPFVFETDSPFEQVAWVWIDEYAPTFLLDRDSSDNLLFRADFSRRISRENPASPGEVIIAYMVGLGPVTPPVETGAFTPLDVQRNITPGFQCSIEFPVKAPVDVLFAGLAPGLLGVYQVSMRVPQIEILTSSAAVYCGWPSSVMSSGALLPFRNAPRQ